MTEQEQSDWIFCGAMTAAALVFFGLFIFGQFQISNLRDDVKNITNKRFDEMFDQCADKIQTIKVAQEKSEVVYSPKITANEIFKDSLSTSSTLCIDAPAFCSQYTQEHLGGSVE